jgi:hypothetical protein
VVKISGKVKGIFEKLQTIGIDLKEAPPMNKIRAKLPISPETR